jgi:hypothetical protein
MHTKYNLKIKNTDTGEIFYTTESMIYSATRINGDKLFSACDRNRAIKAARTTDGFSTWYFDEIKACAEKYNEIETEEQLAEKIELAADWHNHSATQKQLDYLASLGVKTDGLHITKGRASEMIEIAKTQGVGSLGQSEIEGTQYIGEVY